VKKCNKNKQVTDDKTAHELCVLDK